MIGRGGLSYFAGWRGLGQDGRMVKESDPYEIKGRWPQRTRWPYWGVTQRHITKKSPPLTSAWRVHDYHGLPGIQADFGIRHRQVE